MNKTLSRDGVEDIDRDIKSQTTGFTELDNLFTDLYSLYARAPEDYKLVGDTLVEGLKQRIASLDNLVGVRGWDHHTYGSRSNYGQLAGALGEVKLAADQPWVNVEEGRLLQVVNDLSLPETKGIESELRMAHLRYNSANRLTSGHQAGRQAALNDYMNAASQLEGVLRGRIAANRGEYLEVELAA